MILRTRRVLAYASSNVRSPTFALTHSSRTFTSRKYPDRMKRRMRRRRVWAVRLRDPKIRGSSLFELTSSLRRVNAVRSIPSPFRKSKSSSSVWIPTRAAIKAPVAVPVMILGSRPRRCNALTTPKWQRPNMAPPCRTSVERPNACLVSWRRSSLACDVHPLS